MKEKLIEVVAEVLPYSHGCPEYIARAKAEMITDKLIANGVLLPPVKVGQKVYTIPRSAIREWTVCGVWISADPKCSYAHIYWEKDGHHMGSRAVNFSDLSRTVFLSREEAEAALSSYRKEIDHG